MEPGARCAVAEFNCFGLCGRGPNVSIDWDDGSEEMETAVRGSERLLEIIWRATGSRPEALTSTSSAQQQRGSTPCADSEVPTDAG